MKSHISPRIFALAALFAVLTLDARGVRGQEDDSKSAESVEQREGPALTIGSPAPAIDVEHWVSDGHGKFEKVTEFENGKVYVVEFWATWCGPCIASMPHLAETQEKYADKGVQIISISDEDMDTVNEFLERKTGKGKEAAGEETEDPAPETFAELTSAYCLTTDPDRSVFEDYMEAAEQNGIPTCFIVGKEGHIEWIGHPMEMDDPLEQVVSGKWDRERFREGHALITKITDAEANEESEEAIALIKEGREKFAGDEAFLNQLDQLEFRVVVRPILGKFESGEEEAALEELAAFAETARDDMKQRANMIRFSMVMRSSNGDQAAGILRDVTGSVKEPQVLNQLAWMVYEASAGGDTVPPELLNAAIEAAEKAVELAPEDGMILDTLAHLVHVNGELDRAIELQTKALKNPGAAAADIKAFLEQLQEEKEGKGDDKDGEKDNDGEKDKDGDK